MGIWNKLIGDTQTSATGTGTGTTTFMNQKEKETSLLGNGRKLKVMAIALAGIGLVGAMGFMFSYQSKTNEASKAIEAAGSVQVSAQNMIRNAKSAGLGEEVGINGLASDKKDISDKLSLIKDILSDSDKTTKLETEFSTLSKDVKIVVDNKSAIIGIDKTFAAAKFNAKQIGFVSEELVSVLLQNDAKVNQVAEAERMKIITEKIPAIISTITERPETIRSYKALEKEFRGYVAALNQGLQYFQGSGAGSLLAQDPIVAGRLDLGSKIVTRMYATTNKIVENLEQIGEAQKSVLRIQKNSENVSNLARDTIRELEGVRSSAATQQFIAIAFGLLLIGGIVLFLWVGGQEERARSKQTKAEKDKTEAAIMRLLQEISELSRGDLRSKATVTEDITGVIADSINMTIDELNRLIKEINTGAASVTDITSMFSSTIDNISKQSSKQVTGVDEVNQAVHRLTESINHVADSASISADVAKESLQAAEEGYENVHNSITGMNAIRETIQATSKRIKSLGESAQSIGEIADLVSEITEKTNVLALNAFIQAAAAGEQGRGFRVIAGEIQNMAERSNESLNKVTALIASIQTDMQEAISAMEQTSNGVVEGSKIAQKAGESLDKIRDVSNKLGEMIKNISDATAQQNNEATKVSQNMGNILSIAQESALLAESASKGVIEVNSTVSGLKKAVERFTVEE